MDNLDDLASQIQNTKEDIAESEALEYVEKWSSTIVSVPATFVNWRTVAGTVLVKLAEAGNPGELGSWNTKAEVTPEIVEALGAFGNYVEPFVDYVNFERKAAIRQNISVFAAVGYLDLVLDDKGRESYVPVNLEEEPQENIDMIYDVIEAYENFR